MHELLKHVLTERDLTRAGDIFAIPDADIVDDLNEVVSLFICIKSCKARLYAVPRIRKVCKLALN